MTRGRKPAPVEVQKLTGVPTRGKSENKKMGARPLGAPFPSMSDRAKEIWAELAGEWGLVLTRSDRRALRLYCDAWVDMEVAQARVESDGAMVMTPNGMVQKSPWLVKVEQSREFLRKMLPEFGASPSARTRVSAADEDDDDPTAEFFN
ncbi:phage terminase small subunit P27 family [Pseudogemmobacter sonorensis]|uniref:phage terminase small subunit P27 family n=1 Tax=Pseudogemmobacter sonorensis TaxID=2989681 RepID=UPI003682DC8C